MLRITFMGTPRAADGTSLWLTYPVAEHDNPPQFDLSLLSCTRAYDGHDDHASANLSRNAVFCLYRRF